MDCGCGASPPHVAWLVVRTTHFHPVPSALTPPPSHGDHEQAISPPAPAPHRVNHLRPWTGSSFFHTTQSCSIFTHLLGAACISTLQTHCDQGLGRTPAAGTAAPSMTLYVLEPPSQTPPKPRSPAPSLRPHSSLPLNTCPLSKGAKAIHTRQPAATDLLHASNVLGGKEEKMCAHMCTVQAHTTLTWAHPNMHMHAHTMHTCTHDTCTHDARMHYRPETPPYVPFSAS